MYCRAILETSRHSWTREMKRMINLCKIMKLLSKRWLQNETEWYRMLIAAIWTFHLRKQVEINIVSFHINVCTLIPDSLCIESDESSLKWPYNLLQPIKPYRYCCIHHRQPVAIEFENNNTLNKIPISFCLMPHSCIYLPYYMSSPNPVFNNLNLSAQSHKYCNGHIRCR